MNSSKKISMLLALFAIYSSAFCAAPAQQLLLPQEIEQLQNEDEDLQYEAIIAIKDRGIDLAKIDAYLAQNEQFKDIRKKIFLALEVAIEYRDLQLLDYIIQHYPEAINEPTIYGSPLNQVLTQLQTSRENLPILRAMVKLLVNNGANIESSDQPNLDLGDVRVGGLTPLLQAVDSGDEHIVAFLLSKGANVNAHNQFGLNALDMAKQRSNSKPDIYEPIVHLIENYTRSRHRNRIFQQDKRLPTVTHEMITQYVGAGRSVPTPGARAYIQAPRSLELNAQAVGKALREVVQGLKSNNIAPLEDYIATFPKDLNAQNESGDSLLILAIKAGNADAIRLIIQSLEELDIAEGNVNNRLDRALNHTNGSSQNAHNVALASNNNEIIAIIQPYYE